MKTARSIIIPSVFTAILIGGQFVLSGISGIEIVTALLLSFSYKYGVKQGLFVANAFSLLRCFIFGFIPSVIAVYLIYYNIFVVTFGLIGKCFKRSYSVKKHVIIIVTAVIMTALFTLIDDVLTPLMYGFTYDATKAYFITSLYAVIPQVICTLVTTSLLFPLLLKIMNTAFMQGKDYKS